jgi:thioester reductase-like protein/acyl carrier protein
MAIIAEESGLAIADLTDDTAFADVGIDSLLGLTITARFKEELDMDVDFDVLFNEYRTIGDLKRALGGGDVSSTPTHSTPTSGSLGTVTPTTSTSVATPGFDFKQALSLISEESGVAMSDLTDDTNFAESGVDSLLSLVIVSRFRDELDLDIQQESLFLECPTVGDLKKLLLGDAAEAIEEAQQLPETNTHAQKLAEDSAARDRKLQLEIKNAAHAMRRKAVDEYVEKYTAGFSMPSSSPSSTIPSTNEKVVLVTGGTGSLGGHLVYHMAQLPDVTRVVCLNRANKEDPFTRQKKAMRAKGIRFPDALKPKLLIYQTDTSEPMFGLTKDEYDGLVNSVTHLIHNAWPMSAKRTLEGFEPQFQVMQNLIKLASDAASKRPENFKFSFQMVSSIGVVGRYNLEAQEAAVHNGEGEQKIVVPEDRVDIDAVLPNGYGEAKWGCERMLDATLHQYPNRFRAMVVRLGQIAGSKTSGYWNPMEHFGFLIKSSQTLNALPDVPGNVYWTPVNDVADSLIDLVLAENVPYPVYHIDNPVGQAWSEVSTVIADALNIPHLIPFREWLDRVRMAPSKNNPASTLVDFLEDNYLRMSCGGLVLDVKQTVEHSKTLAALGPVSEEIVRKYIHIWKEIKFLN